MVNGVEVETTLSLTSHVLAALAVAKGGVTGVSYCLPPVFVSICIYTLMFGISHVSTTRFLNQFPHHVM